jgi:hypothetical protein
MDTPFANTSPLTGMPVFESCEITKEYQMGEVKIQALRGVDLDLFQGEFGGTEVHWEGAIERCAG